MTFKDDFKRWQDTILRKTLDRFPERKENFETLTDISVDVSKVHINHAFSPGVKVQLIRIVQEALTNVRKHALACTVTISAFEQENDVILEVHDNGQGFSPEETQPVSQYGLRSMP